MISGECCDLAVKGHHPQVNGRLLSVNYFLYPGSLFHWDCIHNDIQGLPRNLQNHVFGYGNSVESWAVESEKDLLVLQIGNFRE